MQGITPFLYYSQITLPYTWQDSNCFTGSDGILCLRPVRNGDFAYEEVYISGFPINISDAAKKPSFAGNLSSEYYEQRIASLTKKAVNGSWSSPYYYFDRIPKISYALQTLSIPLEFNAAGTCAMVMIEAVRRSPENATRTCEGVPQCPVGFESLP